jgi:hypothetical protein
MCSQIRRRDQIHAKRFAVGLGNAIIQEGIVIAP